LLAASIAPSSRGVRGHRGSLRIAAAVIPRGRPFDLDAMKRIAAA
jgi:hypothetical protein